MYSEELAREIREKEIKGDSTLTFNIPKEVILKAKKRAKRKSEIMHDFTRESYNIFLTGEIGEECIYTYLYTISCMCWRPPWNTLAPDFIFRDQIYFDEYNKQYINQNWPSFLEYKKQLFSISDITIYPFLTQIKTTTKFDTNQNNPIEKALNSDIYIFIFYDNYNYKFTIKGWISKYELSKTRDLVKNNNKLLIPIKLLHKNIKLLIDQEEIPEEYAWQSKRSQAHRIIGSLICSAICTPKGFGYQKICGIPKSNDFPFLIPCNKERIKSLFN